MQDVCIEGVNNYPFTMQFAPDHDKTQEMCVRYVNACSFVLILFPINIRLKTCDKAVGNYDHALELVS